jgi:hypothetical protein
MFGYAAWLRFLTIADLDAESRGLGADFLNVWRPNVCTDGDGRLLAEAAECWG